MEIQNGNHEKEHEEIVSREDRVRNEEQRRRKEVSIKLGMYNITIGSSTSTLENVCTPVRWLLW